MPDLDKVATHYAHDGLLKATDAGVRKLGRTPDTVAIKDLDRSTSFTSAAGSRRRIFSVKWPSHPTIMYLISGAGFAGRAGLPRRPMAAA